MGQCGAWIGDGNLFGAKNIVAAIVRVTVVSGSDGADGGIGIVHNESNLSIATNLAC